MSRLPSPPARTTAITFFGAAMAGPYGVAPDSHYGDRRARGSVDPGVSARRLWRGRRSRREPRGGAEAAGRRPGPGVRRAAAGPRRERVPGPAGARVGERGA